LPNSLSEFRASPRTTKPNCRRVPATHRHRQRAWLVPLCARSCRRGRQRGLPRLGKIASLTIRNVLVRLSHRGDQLGGRCPADRAKMAKSRTPWPHAGSAAASGVALWRVRVRLSPPRCGGLLVYRISQMRQDRRRTKLTPCGGYCVVKLLEEVSVMPTGLGEAQRFHTLHANLRRFG
jgi:hypothetical protein